MKPNGAKSWVPGIPWLATVAGVGAILLWLRHEPDLDFTRREPGADQAPRESGGAAEGNPVLRGTRTTGPGQPSSLPGQWPFFRGPDGTGISHEPIPLAKSWPEQGPPRLWAVDLGEGYAGPVVREGRVYLMDYDQAGRQDVLRCLSLDDGREIWRFAYPVNIKRNHGMSRTVPAVSAEHVVAMGPKCHVLCLQARTGELVWGLDLVQEYHTTVPPWYTGQCPLMDGDVTVLAPGGTEALLLAVRTATGEVLWKTPNPKRWNMTHSSVVPMTFAGRKMYVYCASLGVVGVSAEDGQVLWETGEWRISIATIPSPVILPGGRLFLAGGYDAGSLMLQLEENEGRIEARTLFRLGPEIFGATQHTPIYFQEHIYGVRPDGQMTCLNEKGDVLWTSGPEHRYGLGPFLLAQDGFLIMDDHGHLDMAKASSEGFERWTGADVLQGRESWGPMALVHGRLLARDLQQLICLDLSPSRSSGQVSALAD